MQNTLDGLEFDEYGAGIQEKATIKLIDDFLKDKEKHLFDAVIATELVQCAKAIDSYVRLSKNPSTLFEQYNNALDRLQALHPEPLAGMDNDVVDFLGKAAR